MTMMWRPSPCPSSSRSCKVRWRPPTRYDVFLLRAFTHALFHHGGQPEDCARAAEVVVKSVKAFLNDKAAAEDPSIKAIQFLSGRALFTIYFNTLKYNFGQFAK